MLRDETLWEQGIAVIGMSGRFPGAKDVEAYWKLLSQGDQGVRFYTDEELLQAGVREEVLQDSQYIKAKGVLDDPVMFDAAFFGMNPREAEWTDPQQRLFLECAHEALENAGWISDGYPGRIGVYGGCSLSTYLLNHVIAYGLDQGLGDITSIVSSNDKDFLTSRVSYKLDLKGPAVTVQTACSTSLVAVHMACQSLMSGECDIALAGGSSVTFPNHSGYKYQEGMILSPDGICRAFDSEAQGSVPGNGVGIVVLKRLEKAAADGDFIYAVIRGTAINNDGALKAGFTAPSPEGQADVVAEALAIADVHPETISYVEAHGTATIVGDPIEIEGLTMAYRQWTDLIGYCAIGSVKTNIGHLDCAAGVAGFIKTVLALHHRQIPPSLHFKAPNPQIDFAESPFYVNTALRDWEDARYPRRAGVSSFGIGSTNAHVVLEEAPLTESDACLRPWHSLLISAKSEKALAAACERMAGYLTSNPFIPFEEITYTTQVGRKAYPFRKAVVCQNAADAQRMLAFKPGSEKIRSTDEQPMTVWILLSWLEESFSGLLELYRTEPLFRRELNEAIEKAESVSGLELKAAFKGFLNDAHANQQHHPLQLNSRMKILISVAASYSLASVLNHMGQKPDRIGGKEEGEYAAACIAGCCSLEEAFKLALARQDFIENGDIEKFANTVNGIRFAAPRIPTLNAEMNIALYKESELTAKIRERSLSSEITEALKNGRWRAIAIGSPLHTYTNGHEDCLSCFDCHSWANTLAAIWEAGNDVNWQARYGLEKRRRMPLPTYPFERQRYEIPNSRGFDASSSSFPNAKSNERLEEPNYPAPLEYESPRQYVEQKLIVFFEEVLGVPELDIHAPFYELGADSLNKMQVISRIREMYPISLNVQELYAAETISELADIIELAYIELLEKEEEEGEEKTHDQSAFVSTT